MSLMHVLVKIITKLIKNRKHATCHKFCFEKAKLNAKMPCVRSPITHTDEHIPILLKQGYKVTIYCPVKHQTLQWNVVKKEPQEMLILHKDSGLH